MDIKLTIFHSIIFLIGFAVLIFNKEIGDFADKHLRIGGALGKYIIWFPRINAVVIGTLLALGGLLNLIGTFK